MAGQDIHQVVNDPGGRLDPEDARDYPYEGFVGFANEIAMPDSFDVEKTYGALEQKNQYQTLACGGFAVSYYAEMLNIIDEGYIRFSPRFYYSRTHLDNGGSFTRDNVMLLVNEGALAETRFSTEPITEDHLRNASDLTDALKKEALRYKGKLATALDKGSPFELYKLAIWHGHGVVLSLNLSAEGWYRYPARPPKSGEKIVGHIMYAKGYGTDENGDYILLKDSYPSGDKKIYRDYFDAGYVHTAWTVIDEPNPEEEQMVTIDNTRAIAYFMYKEILGREPENSAVLEQHAEYLAEALNTGNEAAVAGFYQGFVPEIKQKYRR